MNDASSPQRPEAPTPMMQQYLDIKAANAGSLLFYRMGDFYELFFEDAEIASATLGIVLTKRGKHLGTDIPMCGVPVHAADDYLSKLIVKGHRVAVCEQIEDPAEARKRGAKSVVRRDVVRLVTPGTITEDRLLAPGESSFLMALARTKSPTTAYALAWLELSTGAFKVCETTHERLGADIFRIDPRELILPDALFRDEALKPTLDLVGRVASPQPAALFDSATAPDRVARFYGVSTTDGFASFSRAELAAISGIVAFVEKTQKAERPPLSRPEREGAGTTMLIDAATRASLELLRTLSGNRDGSLLSAVDRTVTGAGARLLAERLTAPLTDADAIISRQDSVALFSGEQRLRDGVRTALKGIADMPRALTRLALNRGGPRDLGALRSGFAAAARLTEMLDAVDLPGELDAAHVALRALPQNFGDTLGRALADDLPLLPRAGGFVAAQWNGELDEMRTLASDSRKVIAGLERALASETGVKALKIRHNNVLGYYIEVSATHHGALTGSDEAKARFIHRQTMAGAMRFTTTDLADLETRIANAAGRALAIESAVFRELIEQAVAHAGAIRDGARALATLDVSAALAALAMAEGWTRPVVDHSVTFCVEGGRHPVVEAALRAGSGEAFVANDCDLSPEGTARHGAIWLLTGPNMGGKSTYLRQNALIAVLAQTGSFVPARKAHIGIVDRLFSRVGASDDLARGRSTFMVEMVETAAILNQAGERALVILDEIGRGTATYDGLSIAWAAVEYLHETNRCRALFATHFHEITALSKKLPRIHTVTMRVKEWEGDVIFLHEVAKGAADRSYGIQVARLAGLPNPVVWRARAVLEQLEKGEASGRAHAIVDDLPLFSAAVRREAPKHAPSRRDVLSEALAALDPDELTPKAALEALYRLKRMGTAQD